MKAQEKRARLRRAIEAGETLVAPGCYDALSAMLVEEAGFPAAYISGFSVEGSLLGKPDMGFLGKTEMLETSRRISQALDIPVISDMEGGYGSAVQLADHIRQFEAAGLAGIHLDDEVPPCKCPFIPGIPPVDLISKEEMVGRIRRAVEAREDPNFLVIARCDLFSKRRISSADEAGIPEDLMGEYVERIQAYAEAGADLVFVFGKTKEQYEEVSRAVSIPKLAIVNPWVQVSLDDFKAMGTSIVISSMPLLFVAAKAVRESLQVLKTTGNIASIQDRMIDDSDYWRLMRVDEYPEIFERYSIP